MAEKPPKNTSRQHRKTKTQFKGNRRGGEKRNAPRGGERQQRTPLEMFVPTKWSPKGEAVFMDGSRRKLLWGGIPSEKSLFRMVYQGQNQDLLEFVRSNRPHATRVSPLCAHYDRCVDVL